MYKFLHDDSLYIQKEELPKYYFGGEPTGIDFSNVGEPDENYLMNQGFLNTNNFVDPNFNDSISGPVDINENVNNVAIPGTNTQQGQLMTRTTNPMMAIAGINYGMGYLANMLNARQDNRYYRKHGLLQPALTSLTNEQRYGRNMYMEEGGEYYNSDIADLQEIENLFSNQSSSTQEEEDVRNTQEEYDAERLREYYDYNSNYDDDSDFNSIQNLNNNSNSSNSNYTPSNVSVSEKAINYRDYLINNFGYSKEEASGIIGNLNAESSLRSDIQNNIGAFGLAQWLGDRKSNLQSFAKRQNKNVNDPYLQLDFLHHELQTTEKKAFNNLKGKNLSEATSSFMNNFERPSEKEKQSSINKRLNFANSLYKMKSGGQMKKYSDGGQFEDEQDLEELDYIFNIYSKPKQESEIINNENTSVEDNTNYSQYYDYNFSPTNSYEDNINLLNNSINTPTKPSSSPNYKGVNSNIQPLFDEYSKKYNVGNLGIWGDKAHQKRKSDHNTGDAIDLDTHGQYRPEVIDSLVNEADQRNIKYIIHNGKIWSKDKASQGWRNYTGSNAHKGHIHVSFYNQKELGGEQNTYSDVITNLKFGGEVIKNSYINSILNYKK